MNIVKILMGTWDHTAILTVHKLPAPYAYENNWSRFIKIFMFPG